uniref:Secreted protein n=1 Tax=Anopheles culicifacies TaxID=139723 RepID=A0A182LYS2_9DIPT
MMMMMKMMLMAMMIRMGCSAAVSPLVNTVDAIVKNLELFSRTATCGRPRGNPETTVATRTPKGVGEDRADRAASDMIAKGSGFIASLKPSPSLTLFSSVTNLFYHHRKAFRRKNGDGRYTIADVTVGSGWHGGPTSTCTDANPVQPDTIAAVCVLMHSIIFVVVALAISNMIATATVVLVQFRTNQLASLRS